MAGNSCRKLLWSNHGNHRTLSANKRSILFKIKKSLQRQVKAVLRPMSGFRRVGTILTKFSGCHY